MRASLVALVGCGMLACSAAKVHAPVVAPASVAEPVSEPERRPYAELSTVSAAPARPPVIWLRVADPALWDKLPKSARSLPGLAMLAEATGEPRDSLDEGTRAVIDWAQPVDMAMRGPGPFSPSSAWCFRVRSPEAVLRGQTGLVLRRVAAGVWDIGQPPVEESEPDEEEEEGEEDMAAAEATDVRERLAAYYGPKRCRLHHLPEPIGFRVVCTTESEEREAETAFLLGRPPQVGGDVHVELTGAAYAETRKMLAEGFRTIGTSDHSSPDRLLVASAFEALLEHESFTFDLSLTGGGSAQLELAFPAQLESPQLAAWLDLASRAKLPQALGSLPADSGLALGLSGISPTSVQQLAEAIGSLWTDYAPLSARDDAERKAAFAGLFPSDGRFSVAIGRDTKAALELMQSSRMTAVGDSDLPLSVGLNLDLQEVLGGWTVVGVEQAPASYLPAVRRFFRSTQARSQPAASSEPHPYNSAKLQLVPGAPAGLPPGTLHLLQAYRSNAEFVRLYQVNPAPPYDVHLLFVPDRQRVWIVIARSTAVAVAQARRVLASSTERIEQRAELVARAGKPTAALLWVDAATWAMRGKSWDEPGARSLVLSTLLGLNRAPQAGRARVPVVAEVEQHSGGGWSLRRRSNAFVDIFADLTAAEPRRAPRVEEPDAP